MTFSTPSKLARYLFLSLGLPSLCPSISGFSVEHTRFTLSKRRRVPSKFVAVKHCFLSSEDDDTNINFSENDSARLTRATVSGLSVSDSGFWAILQVDNDQYVPIQMTGGGDDCADRAAATSPEALTLLQLVSGVDMAGAILPPDILAKIVVLTCEQQLQMENTENVVATRLLDMIRGKLNNPSETYTEQHPWIKSRISLPVTTLDEVFVMVVNPHSPCKENIEFELSCRIRGIGNMSCRLQQSIVQSVRYHDIHHDSKETFVLAAFFAIALALRYKAPITICFDSFLEKEGSNSTLFILTKEQLRERFPLYRTVSQLTSSSNRVTANIERGMQVHTLQAALRIALEKNDMAAAAKIRKVLDEMDSMSDLPVQPESDISGMQ